MSRGVCMCTRVLRPGEFCEACGMTGYASPVSPPSRPWPPGQITITPKPLSEEDVRRIIREELARDREARS